MTVPAAPPLPAKAGSRSHLLRLADLGPGPRGDERMNAYQRPLGRLLLPQFQLNREI
jgi:hypothetical protein